MVIVNYKALLSTTNLLAHAVATIIARKIIPNPNFPPFSQRFHLRIHFQLFCKPDRNHFFSQLCYAFERAIVECDLNDL